MIIPKLVQFSAALHEVGILTDRVEIKLEHDDWWKLYCAIDREVRVISYDGRGEPPGTFTLMGIRFSIK